MPCPDFKPKHDLPSVIASPKTLVDVIVSHDSYTLAVTIINDVLERADARRMRAHSSLEPEAQIALGQYLTPLDLAQFISTFPKLTPKEELYVLDPGAGSGNLTVALMARILTETQCRKLKLVLVEIDPNLALALSENFDDLKKLGRSYDVEVEIDFHCGDYLEIGPSLGNHFDFVIMNPPYGKLKSSSIHKLSLKELGINVPNLYSAFMSIAVMNLSTDGQLVAITPRSFMNGVYFKHFREYLLKNMSIDRIHLFDSRTSLFAESEVLQENIIISCTKFSHNNEVILSTSKNLSEEFQLRKVNFNEVVHENDLDSFIRIPATKLQSEVVNRINSLPTRLRDLQLQASTGRIVNFRNQNSLHSEEIEGSFPMVYPSNFLNGVLLHPGRGSKPNWFKPQALSGDNLLLPEGNYVLIKRFSSKEESKRIVAVLWTTEENGQTQVALDNKLNYIHSNGYGLDSELAVGVAIWLNSNLVDSFFRTFSGHTQVNATDLRSLPMPDRQTLISLAQLTEGSLPDQATIDSLVDSVLLNLVVAA